MRQSDHNGMPLLHFASLEAAGGLVHGVSTRHGGHSPAPFDSLNLGKGHDDPAVVDRNLAELRRALGLPRLAWAHQVHGTRIAEVGPDGDGPQGEADGLVCTTPGVGLLIKQADCQAVILHDPEAGVIANLHVGWRGNVADMPGHGVRLLARQYGADPARIIAAISPSLGACCGQFVNWRAELPEWFAGFRVDETHFDLVAVTKAQLAQAGVPPQNVEASGLCTRCDERFFSYRREGLTGRFGTVAALAPQGALR